MPQPPAARMLPQRFWAASIPTALSHEAFARLLTPAAAPSGGSGGAGGPPVIQCCPLEKFLGCVYLRRHLLRLISSDENVSGGEGKLGGFL